MSRIEFETVGRFGDLVVGWDPPVGKYFAQGVLLGEQEPALWEHFTTVDALAQEVACYGLALPDTVYAKLIKHAETNSEESLAWDPVEQRLW